MIEAGKLRHKIQIFKLEKAVSELGDVEEWRKIAGVKAEVRSPNAREIESAGALYSVSDLIVRIRYIEGLEGEKIKVLYRTFTLDVKGVINIGERDRALRLLCARVDK